MWKHCQAVRGGPTATLSPSSGHSKALGFSDVKMELRDLEGTLQAGAEKKSQATTERAVTSISSLLEVQTFPHLEQAEKFYTKHNCL